MITAVPGCKRRCKPTILLVLASTLVSAAEQPPSPSSPRDSGGEARSYNTALGGIEVSLSPDKPEVVFGEPLNLTFTVRNLSDNDLQSLPGGDYRNRFGRPESYSVAVVVRQGQTLPILDAGPSFGGIMGPQKIPAKGTWVRRLFLLHWVKLVTTGVRIDVLHALGKMNSTESLELLRKMTNDSNELVRNEALRYLKLRAETPKASPTEQPKS